jgi:hypothetical protein
VAAPSRFRWDLPFLVLSVVCDEHRNQRHREQQAEHHRTVEYSGGNFNDLIRRPLQEVPPFGPMVPMVVGCNLKWPSRAARAVLRNTKGVEL